MLTLLRDQDSLTSHLQNRKQALTANLPEIQEILAQINKEGDTAIRKLSLKYDRVEIADIQVQEKQLQKAERDMDINLRPAILQAIENIRLFHEHQHPRGYTYKLKDGTKVSFRWRPVKRVGIYIPGGRYPLFSTAIMNLIPAQVAGVQEIAVCTPPSTNGLPAATVLGVCSLMGITEVYRVGGAQAISAFAYGTESIPAVDKITGPGNIYVSAAKQAVSSFVGIDMIAGPTELVVIADNSADPKKVAVELISQAEHDPQALPILLTDSEALVNVVNNSLNTLLADLVTSATAKKAILDHGFVFLGQSIEECITVANEIAPEHLSLQLKHPNQWIDRLIAGAVFVGSDTPVAWGDYWAGPNHTLPTSGQARFRGQLSVQDFMVPYSVIETDSKAIAISGEQVINIAEKEGLAGHAKSISVRRKND